MNKVIENVLSIKSNFFQSFLVIITIISIIYGCSPNNLSNKKSTLYFKLLISRRSGVPEIIDSTSTNFLNSNKNIIVYRFVLYKNGKKNVSKGEGKFKNKKLTFLKSNSTKTLKLNKNEIDSLFTWITFLEEEGNYITKKRYHDSWSVQLNTKLIQRNYYDGEEFIVNKKTAICQDKVTRLLVKNSPIEIEYYPN